MMPLHYGLYDALPSVWRGKAGQVHAADLLFATKANSQLRQAACAIRAEVHSSRYQQGSGSAGKPCTPALRFTPPHLIKQGYSMQVPEALVAAVHGAAALRTV